MSNFDEKLRLIMDWLLWLNVGIVVMTVYQIMFGINIGWNLVSVLLNVAAVIYIAKERLINTWAAGRIVILVPFVSNLGVGWLVWFIHFKNRYMIYGKRQFIMIPCIMLDTDSKYVSMLWLWFELTIYWNRGNVRLIWRAHESESD